MPEAASYKVNANEFDLSFSADDLAQSDMIRVSPGVYNLIRNGRSVNVQLVADDQDPKKIAVTVNGQKFQVQIQEELDLLLQEMGFDRASQVQIKEIQAPMPGLVLDILATAGQDLSAGDPLLILQAMKMENSIVVSTDATIKNIHVEKGQAVDKGQLLVTLE